MSLQDLGALGEAIGGIAVVVSLIYVAYQIRQNSRQIQQNSRQIEASMYHATNDDFYRWHAALAADAGLAGLWLRGLQGEDLTPEERMRFNACATMLVLAYENNFEQVKLGAVQRDPMTVNSAPILALFARPAIRTWWERQGVSMVTPEFREALDALVAREGRTDEAGP